MSKKVIVWFVSTALLLVIGFIGLGIWIPNNIQANRIDSWLIRAQQAGNSTQVSQYLTNYKIDLYENNKVNGQYTTLFKYSGSSMEIYIQTVDGMIERADSLSSQSANDSSYQIGLVNLKTDIQSISPAALLVWEASGGIIWEWIAVLTLLIGGGSLILIMVGICLGEISFKKEKKYRC